MSERENARKEDFTVRTGTIFGRSHVPVDAVVGKRITYRELTA